MLHSLAEALAHHGALGAEVRVLLWVLRATLGRMGQGRAAGAELAQAEIRTATGLSRRTVQRTLKRLAAAGVLRVSGGQGRKAHIGLAPKFLALAGIIAPQPEAPTSVNPDASSPAQTCVIIDASLAPTDDACSSVNPDAISPAQSVSGKKTQRNERSAPSSSPSGEQPDPGIRAAPDAALADHQEIEAVAADLSQQFWTRYAELHPDERPRDTLDAVAGRLRRLVAQERRRGRSAEVATSRGRAVIERFFETHRGTHWQAFAGLVDRLVAEIDEAGATDDGQAVEATPKLATAVGFSVNVGPSGASAV